MIEILKDYLPHKSRSRDHPVKLIGGTFTMDKRYFSIHCIIRQWNTLPQNMVIGTSFDGITEGLEKFMENMSIHGYLLLWLCATSRSNSSMLLHISRGTMVEDNWAFLSCMRTSQKQDLQEKFYQGQSRS